MRNLFAATSTNLDKLRHPVLPEIEDYLRAFPFSSRCQLRQLNPLLHGLAARAHGEAGFPGQLG